MHTEKQKRSGNVKNMGWGYTSSDKRGSNFNRA